MRLILCCLLFQLLSLPLLAQTTYYIASTGSDSNDGRSMAAPFQSIAKLNTLTFQPGDQILFRRSDSFSGMLVIQQSGTTGNPIRIDAYGTGNKPTIVGSVGVTGWTNTGNNVWQATCSSCGSTVTGLYRNGESLPLGRYPNENSANRGYLTVQSHQGKVSLTSQQALPTSFVGGEAVYRPTLWILNRAPITAQSGNTLTLDNAGAAYDVSDGWGFFIQNHPATLDQEGEWAYTASSKTLRLLTAQNPNSLTITATAYMQGVRLLNNNNISVRNLHITQPLNVGLYAANISNAVISDNDIDDSGEDGMLIHGSGTNVTIQNNTIQRVYNNGTEVQSYTALTYQNNVVRQVGLRPGRGKSGDGQYRGVDISVTTNNLFESNRLDSIGYTGMSFSTQTTGLIIRHNIISNYLLTKGDGGGIYTFNGYQLPMSNIKIQSNFVSGATATNEGAVVGSTFTGANGIYLDGCVTGVDVTDNTVFNCRGIGIFMIAVSGNTILRNTSFDNGESQFVIAAGSGCTPRTNNIQSNIFVSRQPTVATARYESGANDLDQYGTIDNNYYIRPFDSALLLNAAFLDVNVAASNPVGLRDWQRLFGKDANAKTSPLVYKGFTINALTGSNRIENSYFNGNALNWYTQSYYGNFKTQYDAIKLDGGSIQLYFNPNSGYRASYGFMFGNAGVIVKGRSYVLRFDAIASADGKTLLAILRQRNAPAQDLAIRIGSVVNSTRKSYEIAFTATQDDPDAILLFSVLEDGQSVWLDNITFQEASINRTDPVTAIQLAINPTPADSLIELGGIFRDVNNQVYNHQIKLTPYSSAVLLQDTAATVDLSLNLMPGKLISQVNEVVPYTLLVRNQEFVNTTLPASAQWTFRLPPNVQFVSGANITNNNGVLTAQTPAIISGTTVSFPMQLRLTQPGNYSMAAELTTASPLDPDSTPGSGTADGEDDASQITVRTTAGGALFVSPNPNQRALPRATLNEPTPDPIRADLKLSIAGSSRVATLSQISTFTVVVNNRGGVAAPAVQVEVTLPAGLQFVDGNGWSANQSVLTGTVGYVPANTETRLVFRTRAITQGMNIVQAQITKSGVGDPDSVVNNGYTNGEDDRASADLRVQ